VLLIYALLRLQSLVRFHGQLWQSLDRARSFIQLDWPALFLLKFGKALAIPVEGPAEKGQPCRIEMGTWVAAHLELRFTRIHWSAAQELTIEARHHERTGSWTQQLEEALGGAVRIHIKAPAH
jgi:hypothetical protein